MGIFMFVLEFVVIGVLLFLVWFGWMAWKAANEGAAEAFRDTTEVRAKVRSRLRSQNPTPPTIRRKPHEYQVEDI